jgi:hypothetical protein
MPIEEIDVEKFVGATKTFTRLGESGKKVDYEFCANCGTAIRWRVERIGNRQGFAGGALDDPIKIEIGGEMYANEALPWARVECEFQRVCARSDFYQWVEQKSTIGQMSWGYPTRLTALPRKETIRRCPALNRRA